MTLTVWLFSQYLDDLGVEQIELCYCTSEIPVSPIYNFLSPLSPDISVFLLHVYKPPVT